jgi:heterodisulfide reductase subunit B
MADQVNEALAEADLTYQQTVKVRHPLDLIVNDIGIDTVARAAKRNLAGLKIAPYYGCQIVRPGPGFDDPDWPTTMDELFVALGAECVYFPDRVRCCGGMLISTFPELGKDLTGTILDTALENGADVVATTCPLCQINLEANQKRNHANSGGIPVLFFTQILGIALGLSFEEMDLHRSIIPLGDELLALAGGAK